MNFHLPNDNEVVLVLSLMKMNTNSRITSIVQLFDRLPENERIIVDVLRPIVRENLPAYCKEKLAFNVPYYYGNRGICIIWPAAIPRGGIKEGVLLGFWQGNKLNDEDGYNAGIKQKSVLQNLQGD